MQDSPNNNSNQEDLPTESADVGDIDTAGQSEPVPNDQQLVPPSTPQSSVNPSRSVNRVDQRRWWIKLCVQPVLFLLCGAVLIAGLGVAQELGLISGGGGHSHGAGGGDAARYICPMMCTPPQEEPGRCPVCAMELVQATSNAGGGGERYVKIDPAARRVANIQTVAVSSMPVTRTIRAVGELAYDEGSLKTIPAYVGGRLEKLYADYTGVVVGKGDHLALLYSPTLYSGQVELLLARQARADNRLSGLPELARSNTALFEGARQKLIELGMTEPQISALESSGEANSRMHLCAPISGTVIEKLAVEGQYVKEGDPIYKLADLSTVWLMLELFPEEAAAIRYGQMVEAELQSLRGRKFTGRVAFINPHVDQKTRTVGVRVVFPNDNGLLRIGDYAKATINVTATLADQPIYDPELADKWISPRHPHIVTDASGTCPLCGVDLVPASQLGFTGEADAAHEALVIPRSAVLNVGSHSVVYVETEIGRFEIREVSLGPNCGDVVVVESGLAFGEHVATRGNFLIDSQMQLAGNPSLIDPTKAQLSLDGSMSPTMIAALERLSPADRILVDAQGVCPVADYRLGEMGTPKKVDVNGVPIFICCEGCRESLLEEPERYLAKLEALKKSGGVVEPATPTLPEMGDFELLVPEPEGGAASLNTHDGPPSLGTLQLVDEEPSLTQPAQQQQAKRVADVPKEARQ